ncbi:hypothetical protein FACS189499_08230 [Clostridia bacterium]|nr:hypothetical protein FACS189499_08230 [Clostridia bacterium]
MYESECNYTGGSLPKSYTTLFNGMSDTISQLHILLDSLEKYQQQAEDLFIEGD